MLFEYSKLTHLVFLVIIVYLLQNTLHFIDEFDTLGGLNSGPQRQKSVHHFVYQRFVSLQELSHAEGETLVVEWQTPWSVQRNQHLKKNILRFNWLTPSFEFESAELLFFIWPRCRKQFHSVVQICEIAISQKMFLDPKTNVFTEWGGEVFFVLDKFKYHRHSIIQHQKSSQNHSHDCTHKKSRVFQNFIILDR